MGNKKSPVREFDKHRGTIGTFLAIPFTDPDDLPGIPIQGNNVGVNTSHCTKQLVAVNEEVFSDPPLDVSPVKILHDIDDPDLVTLFGIHAYKFPETTDKIEFAVIDQGCRSYTRPVLCPFFTISQFPY